MTEKQRLRHIEQNREKNLIGGSATLIGTDRDILQGFREPKTPPRLTWVNAKTHSGFSDRRRRPGRKEDHAEALSENTSRIFAKEIDKTLKPEGESNDTGKDLQDNQGESGQLAAGTQEA